MHLNRTIELDAGNSGSRQQHASRQGQHRLDLFAMALLLVLCACWGLNQVAIKVANGGISPVFGAGIRSVGGTILIYLWCQLRGIRLFERDGTLWPGIIAGVLFGLEFIALYWGLNHTSAARGVILLYTMPFMVTIGAHLMFPAERLTTLRVLGLLAAFGGVIVSFADSLSAQAGQSYLGDVLMLAAAFLWGATILVIKGSALARARAEKTLLYQLGVSAFMLLAVSFALGEPGIFNPTSSVIIAATFQIFPVVTVTYLAWFWLITQYPASQLSAFSFFTPLFGVMAGGLILGERVSLYLLLALALVATGIYLVNRPAKRQED